MLFLTSLLISSVAANLQTTRYARSAPGSIPITPVSSEQYKVAAVTMSKYDTNMRGAGINDRIINSEVKPEYDELNFEKTKQEVFQDWTRTLNRISNLKKERESLEKLNSTPFKNYEEELKVRKAHKDYYLCKNKEVKDFYKKIYEETEKSYQKRRMDYRKLLQEYPKRMKEYNDEIYDLEGIAEITKELYDLYQNY